MQTSVAPTTSSGASDRCNRSSFACASVVQNEVVTLLSSDANRSLAASAMLRRWDARHLGCAALWQRGRTRRPPCCALTLRRMRSAGCCTGSPRRHRRVALWDLSVRLVGGGWWGCLAVAAPGDADGPRAGQPTARTTFSTKRVMVCTAISFSALQRRARARRR